jgi:hypothetical protein
LITGSYEKGQQLLKKSVTHFKAILSNKKAEIQIFFSLAYQIRQVPPKSIWIGDSHAYHLINQGAVMQKISITADNNLLIWIGPRLLYSVSRKGFEFDFLTRIVLKIASKNQNVFFVLGEIDCRVYLVSKTLPGGPDAFAEIAKNYIHEVSMLLQNFGLKRAIIVGPVPPSDSGAQSSEFPRNGTLAERVFVTKMLTESLLKCSTSDVLMVELAPILSVENGCLDPLLSDDGIHVNRKGSKIALDEIFKKEVTTGADDNVDWR